MTNQEDNLDELLSIEQQFLNLAMPSHAFTTNEVLAAECCSQRCIYYLRKIDILSARKIYVKFHNSLDANDKRKTRYLFIDTLRRSSNGDILFVPIAEHTKLCPQLLGNVFGFSIHVLMNAVTDPTVLSFKSREWYSSKVKMLSDAMAVLSRYVQFNSLDQVMVPSNFAARMPDFNSAISINDVRSTMDLRIRVRKNDTLVRTPQNNFNLTGANKYKNGEYPMIAGLYRHDTDFNVSLILNTMSKMASIPTVLYIIMDSAGNNKSHAMFAGLGFILSRIPLLEQIVVLYPVVGHTHLSCDGHFGNVSRSLMSRDILDPKEYTNFLESYPGVCYVEKRPTIFDFSGLLTHTNKPAGLCSNGQIIISRSSNGEIFLSSAPSLNASVIFGADSSRSSMKLFLNGFEPSKFCPTIRKPNIDNVKAKMQSLFKVAGSIFKEENRDDYLSSLEVGNHDSSRFIFASINQKQPKVRISGACTSKDPNITVLEYLEQAGIHAGRIPKRPEIP
ncbi:unnamed protein product [Caenorhabditis nigoni]